MIDENGDHVGVVAIDEALRRAKAAGLDLVEISSSTRPYVCRVMDYGNYKYERAKKQREAKKKQHATDVKEVKLRPRIDDHDYGFKLRNAYKFLMQGHKVRFIVMFRGRERGHIEFGFKLLDRVIEDLKEISIVESRPRAEGRNLTMGVAPNPLGIKAEKARLEKENRLQLLTESDESDQVTAADYDEEFEDDDLMESEDDYGEDSGGEYDESGSDYDDSDADYDDDDDYEDDDYDDEE